MEYCFEIKSSYSLVQKKIQPLNFKGCITILIYRQFYSLLPVNNLYRIRITASTIKIWIILPKSGNAKYPTSHPITSNTTISQIKSLIRVVFGAT